MSLSVCLHSEPSSLALSEEDAVPGGLGGYLTKFKSSVVQLKPTWMSPNRSKDAAMVRKLIVSLQEWYHVP
jgi:hypothetical protein